MQGLFLGNYECKFDTSVTDGETVSSRMECKFESNNLNADFVRSSSSCTSDGHLDCRFDSAAEQMLYEIQVRYK